MYLLSERRRSLSNAGNYNSDLISGRSCFLSLQKKQGKCSMILSLFREDRVLRFKGGRGKNYHNTCSLHISPIILLQVTEQLLSIRIPALVSGKGTRVTSPQSSNQGVTLLRLQILHLLSFLLFPLSVKSQLSAVFNHPCHLLLHEVISKPSFSSPHPNFLLL